MENLFAFGGRPGHEIVFVFAARLEDEALYQRDAIPGTEGAHPFMAYWRPVDDIRSGRRPLYPAGLVELLAPAG